MTEPRSVPGTARELLLHPRTWIAMVILMVGVSVALFAPVGDSLGRFLAFWIGLAVSKTAERVTPTPTWNRDD